MLTITRRDQRTRRRALFTLETLDDRLVLSASAAGAAAEAASAHAAAVHARHEAKLARIEARGEASLARWAAHHPMSTAPAPILIGGSTAAATPASTSAAASGSAAASPSFTPATPTSGGTIRPTAVTASPMPSTPNDVAPVPLPANVAAALQSLYTEFKDAGSGEFKPSDPIDNTLQISGDNVEVSLKIGSVTDFNSALSQLKSDGMQISASSSTYGLIEGMLPISELPAAGQLASSVTAVPKPAF